MRDLDTFNEALVANEVELEQNPRTVDSRSRNGLSRAGGVESENPPDDIVQNRELFETTPILFQGFNKFAADVIEPGWRIEADNPTTEDDLTEWGENAAVVGGQRHKDIRLLAKQSVIAYQIGGDILSEHIKASPDVEDITGLRNIPVETVHPQTHEGKAILLGPDETDVDGAVTTPRDEAAAFIQWHQNSVLGSRGQIDEDKDTIPFSQNDVTKTSYNPGVSDIWGRSPMSSIAERTQALKQKLRDNEEAIRSKAYGIWSVSFGRELLDPTDLPAEITEWSGDAQEDFMDDLGDLGPGEMVGHDGTVELEKFEGEVADILDLLLFDIDYILSAVPSPKFAVGFGEQITQHVTERQSDNYHQDVRDMQGVLENHFTEGFRKRAEQQGLADPESVKFKLEPPEDESPVTSLKTEEIEKVETFTEALANSSPTGDPLDLVTNEALNDLVLQLPEDAQADSVEVLDEADPQVIGEAEPPEDGAEEPEPEPEPEADGG